MLEDPRLRSGWYKIDIFYKQPYYLGFNRFNVWHMAFIADMRFARTNPSLSSRWSYKISRAHNPITLNLGVKNISHRQTNARVCASVCRYFSSLGTAVLTFKWPTRRRNSAHGTRGLLSVNQTVTLSALTAPCLLHQKSLNHFVILYAHKTRLDSLNMKDLAATFIDAEPRYRKGYFGSFQWFLCVDIIHSGNV